MPTITYPLDITGVSPLNLVTDEQHAVTEANFWNYNFIVPHCAPFFITNLKVRHYNLTEVVELVEGIDYFPTLQYIGATRSIGRVLYGAITLNRTITSGIVSIDYQTLGGEWIANRDIVLRNLAEIVYNPRLTVWETVTDKQAVFPPMDHEQDLDTLYGLKELIDSILGVGNVIVENRDQLGIVKHLTNYDNPHKVSKEQLGIPRIGNWGMATNEQIDEHIDTESLINPSTLHYALSSYRSGINDINERLNLLTTQLNNHTLDSDAHGLAIVRQSIVETQGELQAFKLAISQTLYTLSQSINSHISDIENPHDVTKAQIGLNLVENIALASDDEVSNRERINKHVTLKQLIALLESWGGFAPTTDYAITATTTIAYEGDSVYCSVLAPNSPDGEVVYWFIGHITTNDADFVGVSGSATIINGQAAVEVIPLIDPNNESDEYFTVKLRKDSPTGDVVATTSTIRLSNTSSTATYQVVPFTTLIGRGESTPVSITTTEIPNGTLIYWTIEHLSTLSSDFVRNTGVVQIVSNSAGFTLETVASTVSRLRESFRIQLRLGSISGTILATSDVLSLKETVTWFTLRSGHGVMDATIPITVDSVLIRSYKDSLPRRTIRKVVLPQEYDLFLARSHCTPNDPNVALRPGPFYVLMWKNSLPRRVIR